MGVNDGQSCHGLGGGTATPSSALLACIKANYAQLTGIKRDTFALNVQPTNTQIGNGGWQLWYMTSVFDALSASDSSSMAITSTGYLSDTLVVNFANDTTPPAPQCTTLLTSSVSDANDWFTYLVDLSTRYSIGFMSFTLGTDVLPSQAVTSCPCKVSDPSQQVWCDFISLYRKACQNAGLASWGCEGTLKIGATLGVRDITNVPKQPLYGSLQTARAAPLSQAWRSLAGAPAAAVVAEAA